MKQPEIALNQKRLCEFCSLQSRIYPGFDLDLESVASVSSATELDPDETSCECQEFLDLAKSERHRDIPELRNLLDLAKKVSTEQSSMLGITRAGKTVPMIEGSQLVVLSNARCPWKFAEIEMRQTGPYENADMIWLIPTVVLIETEESINGEFRLNGRMRRSVFHKDSVSLIPVGDVGRWASPHAHGVFQLAIKPSLLADLALDFRLSERVELPFMVPFDDALVVATMRALKKEAIAGFRSGSIYGDTLVTALTAHLLSRYNLHSQRVSGAKGQLSGLVLRTILDFLKENFHRDIALAELSALANMSPFHFSRLFKESTGLSPHQYLIQYRVKRARDLLKSGLSLKHVARAVGFWDASHLTRHFRRFYGFGPSEWTEVRE